MYIVLHTILLSYLYHTARGDAELYYIYSISGLDTITNAFHIMYYFLFFFFMSSVVAIQ